MKFRIHRAPLLAALKTVSRANTGQSSLPILANLCIEASWSAAIRLFATDLELAIDTTISATVHERGSVTIPAKAFRDIVEAMSGDELTLDVQDNGQVAAQCGRSTCRLHTLPPEEYPPCPVLTAMAFTGTYTEKHLAAALKATLRAVSTDDVRPVHTGVFMDVAGEHLKIVATDTHRLIVYPVPGACAAEENLGGLIVPARSAREVLRLLDADSENAVSVKADLNHVAFEVGGTTVFSRAIEGKYPNYQKLCVQEAPSATLTVNRKSLLELIDRAAIIAKGDANRLCLHAHDDTLEVSAQAEDYGQFHETFDLSIVGQDVEFSINYAYLSDALEAFDAEQVVLTLTGPMAPVFLRPKVDTPDALTREYLALLMPMYPEGC